MIKYNIVSRNHNYHLHYKKLYGLKCKNTYYGVHLNLSDENFDSECSKTSLLFFASKRDAEDFKDIILDKNKLNETPERVLIKEQFSLDTSLTTRAPLNIEELGINEARILCYMHYFNIFIIQNISRNNYEIQLNGNNYETYDYPSKQIIEYLLFRNM